jgi:V8-like Glu-specific endopeptidase
MHSPRISQEEQNRLNPDSKPMRGVTLKNVKRTSSSEKVAPTKLYTRENKKGRSAAVPPFHLDELAKLPDLPATEKMPAEVAATLAKPTLYLTDKESAFDPREYLKPVDKEKKAWQMILPTSAALGLPGRTSGLLDRAEAPEPRRTLTEPFRPAWAGQTHQPRAAAEFPFRYTIRRRDGRIIEPYYGVYGADDRQVYWPGSYPWRCIGRIFTWNNFSQPNWTWWGSGVLVGPRHVLTAGHVAPWGSNNWAMKFVPGYWDGVSVNGPGASSWVSDYRGWNTNQQVAAHDMSVLRLYTPLGSSLGWMGTKVYDGGWEGGPYWTLAGYPAAVAGGNRPSFQSGIPVLDDDEDGDAMEIEHHGDATGGDSGGPFFGFWNDGPYAVGTVSGGETVSGFLGIGSEDNNINAGGNAMVDLVRWAQNTWP